MNYLEQQLPPDDDNHSTSNEFNQKKGFFYTTFPLSSREEGEEDAYLSPFLNALSQPVLLIVDAEDRIFYNPAFEEFCSKVSSENVTIEQTINRLWDIENMQAVINDLVNCYNTGQINKLYRTAKLTKHNRVNYWIYAFNGEHNRRFTCIVFDSTLEKSDKSIEDKSDSSAQTIEIFFSNLSHEIRTPLNAILGFAELLSIKDLSDEQRMNYLDIIRNKGRLLLHYLEDVMELTKLENQTLPFSITDTDLPQLFNEIHREYLKAVQQKASSPELFLKIVPPTEINICYTDRGRLYQLMKYLLDIALLLTEKGYIQWGYELKDARWINYYVKYTGKSLTQEQQKILADPLRIRENVTDPIIQRIGLKFALVKLIARCMEGKFNIESGEQFDTFSVMLPYKRKEPPAVSVAKSINKPNWKNRVIVIAEDDEINFQFLEALLAETHAQIIHVQNGKQVIEICQSLPKVDLILMDLKMPEKNGYEAIKEIKQLKGKEIPIIAQTAYSSKEEKEKCYRMGCDAYLVKPIDVELFFRVLSQFLSE